MMVRMAIVSAIIFAVAIGTAIVRPTVAPTRPDRDIEALLPDHFGEWSRIALGRAILPAEIELGPGEAVAYRAYRDKAGRIVTLVVAYGPPLGDSVRLHQPESCYVAKGFSIVDRQVHQVTIDGSIAPIVRLRAESTTRREAVSYLLRYGDDYVEHVSGHEILNVKRGLSSFSDGALIRLSTAGASDTIFELHIQFIEEFTSALSPVARDLFLAHGS